MYKLIFCLLFLFCGCTQHKEVPVHLKGEFSYADPTLLNEDFIEKEENLYSDDEIIDLIDEKIVP